MKKFLAIALSILFVGQISAQTKSLTLVENSKSKYIIIIPKASTTEEEDAAKLLQKSLKDVCKAKVAIFDETYPRQEKEFVIGRARGLANNNIDFRTYMSSYVVVGEKVLFNGSNTYYSVVDFLERELGMRMFAPDCITFESKKNFSIASNTKYSYTSPNKFREINSSFTKKHKDYQRWIKTDLYQEAFARGFYVHTAEKLLPPSQYFKSHPEYYALVNGQRSREQVCWSNDEVFKIMKENLAHQMALQPDRNWWSVSQNDNDAYCHCDKCMELINKEGSPAAPIIKFVNKMAKAFPNKTISTLAYIYSRKAPKTLVPEKNVQIMLCTIEANRNITIEEEKERTPKGCFAKDLEDWGKKTNNIYLWDYECDFAYYIAPFPNFHVLQPNIQYFVENGATLQFQQANCQTGNDFSELKNYLLAKLLWDPYANQDSIINEFLHGYYGPAAPKVRQYMDDIDSVAISYKGKVSLNIYGAPIRYADNIFSKDNLSRYDSIMEEAEKLVANNKTYQGRVQTVRLAIDYAIMEIAKSDMFGERGWYQKINGKYILRENLKAKLDKFYEVCKKQNVSHMNERGLTPETYYRTSLRFLEIDIENDLAFQKKVTVNPDATPSYCKGNPMVLTDGVRGADDYNMNWLGWWGPDFEIVVDLEKETKNRTISIASLAVPTSWILHPNQVKCLVSLDGKKYVEVGTEKMDGYNRNNPHVKEYTFKYKDKFRYVKFEVKGTNTLPSWHVAYGKKSWVFVDEITVK